jgi:hypothetical protein
MKINSIEPLESRIAPAAVAIDTTHHLATWTDFDGDLVTLKYSSADAPAFAASDNGMGLLVDKITLNAADHSDAAFTLSVKAAGGGDGHIDLGRIDAKGVPLKSWKSPAATIAEIDCGGVGTFVSGTLGAVPYSKFNNTGGDGNSVIDGNVNSFTVLGDVAAAAVFIQSSGKVGAVKIAGSLRGDAPSNLTFSGYVGVTASSLGSLFLGGSIIGGDDSLDGGLQTNQALTGKVTVLGSLVGGSGLASGTLQISGAKTVVIRGDVIGGSGVQSGGVNLANSGIVNIGGSVIGGTKDYSGEINAQSVSSLTIKGSVIGGANTAALNNLPVGAVNITGDLKTFSLGGDLVAGSYGSGNKVSYNGALLVGGNLGSAAIKGSIIGHDGYQAIVMAGGTAPATPGNYNAIGKLTVGGSVSYGYIAAGQTAGLVTPFADRIGTAENPDAGIGSVRVGGDWFHSNLSAGINDASTNGLQSTDTRDMGDAARQAVIGPVAIKGFVLDNPDALGFSGFVAEKIASLTEHGVKVFKSGDAARSLDSHGYVDVAEI